MLSAELLCCHSQILFTRTVQSQSTLIICWIHFNTTNRVQNNSSQYPQHTPQHHHKPAYVFFSHFVFSGDHVVSKAQLMNSRTISRIEIYWQNSNEPACLSCPAAWLSLSRVLGAYAIEPCCLPDSKGLVQLHQLLDDWGESSGAMHASLW